MASRFSVDEAVDHILFPDETESDLEDGDEEENEILEQIDNDLDPDYNPYLDMNAGPLEVEEVTLITEDESQPFPSDPDSQISNQQQRPQIDIPPQKRYKWIKEPYAFPNVSFEGEFSPPPGDDQTPMQYFKMFLDDDYMEYIAEQTNMYALAKDGKVINTSAKEIEQFFGILLFVGVYPCRSYTTYWSNFSRFSLGGLHKTKNAMQILSIGLHPPGVQ